ncbi:hypothetical protein ABEB36_000457 [Hypothenemus hampei]|uniref:Uncharacterized protein n=1 Tax=Hypothenemus hampei TaxID=57062 RepID=A0ABD1FBA2_HYPHA
MPCSKCNSDFTLFNWKIKCGECEAKYCNKCLRRKEGVLYCEVCLILIKRPPDRHKLMQLKPKELRDYLNKHDVSTYGLVEKNELVDLLCNKYIPEKQLKGVDKLTANFGDPLSPINGFFNNIESALSEHRNGRPTTIPAHDLPRTNVPSGPEPTTMHPSEAQPTTSQAAQCHEVTPQPEPSPLLQRHPKLEDFNCAEDLSELSSKQLKILLAVNRVEYKGCIEKGILYHLVQVSFNFYFFKIR